MYKIKFFVFAILVNANLFAVNVTQNILDKNSLQEFSAKTKLFFGECYKTTKQKTKQKASWIKENKIKSAAFASGFVFGLVYAKGFHNLYQQYGFNLQVAKAAPFEGLREISAFIRKNFTTMQLYEYGFEAKLKKIRNSILLISEKDLLMLGTFDLNEFQKMSKENNDETNWVNVIRGL